MRKSISALFLCLLCLLPPSFSGCSKHRSLSAADSILRISQRNEPADLDPATAALPDEFFIIRALGEGLVAPTPASDSVAPATAERWEFSADGLTCTFHLRTDALWSNGEPVTALDFLESYRRVLTPATAAPKAALFYLVRNARAFAMGQIDDFSQVGFRAPDAHTLVVTLDHPSPRFLVYAASGPWIPTNPRVVASFGRAWTRPGNYVGNGPFTLAAWQPHQRIVVRRNPRYHGASAVHLDEIHFVAFDSGDTEDRAYRAGQLDLTMAVPFAKLATYARERPSELHQVPLAETRYLAFNVARPPLNDARVRRALSLAINREQMVERVLRGGEQPAYRLVSPALLAGSTPSASAASPAEGRRLLAEAGYPAGKNFPHLELSTWIVSSPVAETIQAMWKSELGIDVAIVTHEAKVHLSALREGRFDIGFATLIPDVPDAMDVLGRFATGAPENYPHWSDANFDRLLSAAGEAPSGVSQTAQLRAAEDRLLNDAPVAPLYFNAKHWLQTPRVHDWQSDALWTRFYLDVNLSQN